MPMQKPPAAPANGQRAALSCLEVLRKRADFLRAAKGRRKGTAGFHLQAWNRHDDDPVIRVGFTCSKKVGNAVARNRAKRRLREIARLELPSHGTPGWDYVLVGRKDVTATLNFDQMRADLRDALRGIK